MSGGMRRVEGISLGRGGQRGRGGVTHACRRRGRSRYAAVSPSSAVGTRRMPRNTHTMSPPITTGVAPARSSLTICVRAMGHGALGAGSRGSGRGRARAHEEVSHAARSMRTCDGVLCGRRHRRSHTSPSTPRVLTWHVQCMCMCMCMWNVECACACGSHTSPSIPRVRMARTRRPSAPKYTRHTAPSM